MKTIGPDNPVLDFSIGEDANAITIADVNLELDTFTLKQRRAAASQGDLFLISLPEDGGVNGRFRFGELGEEEKQNWLASATRLISFPTGKFAIDAGGFFGRQLDVSETEAVDFVMVEVPPGNYELTCFVYLSSDIATDLFRRRKLSYLDWFRKENLEAPIPHWLVDLAENRDNDYEDERLEELSDSEIDSESDDNFCELLFQLKPASDRTKVAETEISKQGNLKWNKRLPSEFPHPILTSEATARLNTYSMTKLVAKSFLTAEYEQASRVFEDSMQSDVARFLDCPATPRHDWGKDDHSVTDCPER